MKKTYLVVGASKGIGEAVTQQLDAEGHHVIGVSRTTAHCKNWLQADVTTDAGLDAVAAHLNGQKLDALLFIAGAWEVNAFSDDYNFLKSARTETQSILALNLTAPILLSQTLASNLSLSDNPKILLMGSTSGLECVNAREVAYTASKFGLRGASQSLAVAMKPLNIDVSIINPGDVATPEVLKHCKATGVTSDGLIPMSDLLRAIELVLSSSSNSVPTEINVFDKR